VLGLGGGSDEVSQRVGTTRSGSELEIGLRRGGGGTDEAYACGHDVMGRRRRQLAAGAWRLVGG